MNELWDSRFINNLKSSRKSQSDLLHLMLDITKNRYRELTPEDSNKTNLKICYIETKGKGKREILQKVHHCKGNTSKIGNYWGEIYLHDGNFSPHPRRFKVHSHRILIDTYDIK